MTNKSWLTYMMLDADVVACSAGTMYYVLSQAGLLKRNTKRSLKGTGFVQPLAAHAHWHIDISCLNIAGTFCFMANTKVSYTLEDAHVGQQTQEPLLSHATKKDAVIGLVRKSKQSTRMVRMCGHSKR